MSKQRNGVCGHTATGAICARCAAPFVQQGFRKQLKKGGVPHPAPDQWARDLQEQYFAKVLLPTITER